MNTQALETFTNTKGETFNVGDIIVTKGSKVVRKIADIYPAEPERNHMEIRVRAIRVDGIHASFSVYANPDGIKHV